MSSNNQENLSLIEKIVQEAAELLPVQAPLQSFVHHNTLHHFEGMNFKDALFEASLKFGSEAFMSEDFFKKAINEDRITKDDIKKTIIDECQNASEVLFEGGPTRFDFRKWRLLNLFTVPSVNSLNWWIYENNILSDPEKLSLWNALEAKNLSNDSQLILVRLRNKIFNNFSIDIDDFVKPILTKLAGSYLDQGIAFTEMPGREAGFLKAFRKTYINHVVLNEVWMQGLEEECRSQEKYNQDASDVVVKILNILAIPEELWPEFITQTLLVLGGWAGMFYQYECYPQRIPVHNLPAKIMDFLAVQLTLELVAIKFALKTAGVAFEKLKSFSFRKNQNADNSGSKIKILARILQYEAFIAAQAFGFQASNFSAKKAEKWLEEVANFNDFERRYYLLLSYENHYRQMVLDRLVDHQKLIHKTPQIYHFQAVFCMDEREESLRRHLEEIYPQAETFGFAGFFGVAMQYLGLDDIKPRALCPVVITPKILVEEVAIDENILGKYTKTRNIFGKIANFIRKSRKSLIYSAIWSCTAGIVKIIPLIGRSLFPLKTAQLLKGFHKIWVNQPKTRLKLERTDENEYKFGYQVGFSIEEMTDIVFSVLNAMNLKKNFAKIVIFVGHGSSSLNNPHEAAYNCGATGGGKGGNNARAFAIMANHKKVRKNLKLKEINIPDETVFVGAGHDTCSNSIEYFDVDLLNEEATENLKKVIKVLEEASNHNAHERCRRFDSVPKNIKPAQAKLYAEQRSLDLAQPRPEYGHGTNTTCIIGRREKTTGLFFDRRAFLISYDPENDPNGDVLANILQAAAPVGAGISLEYYFSSVDQFNYGAGTKLPHNITGLIGVMDGYSSDLRTGLPWQTVEIHEPMRLLTIIEAKPQILEKIAKEKPEVGRLVANGWIQFVAWNPENNEFSFYNKGQFIQHKVENKNFARVKNSKQYYSGKSGHLNCVHIIKSGS